MSILIDRDRFLDWCDAEIAERRAAASDEDDELQKLVDAAYIEGLSTARFYGEAIAVGIDRIGTAVVERPHFVTWGEG